MEVGTGNTELTSNPRFASLIADRDEVVSERGGREGGGGGGIKKCGCAGRFSAFGDNKALTNKRSCVWL